MSEDAHELPGPPEPSKGVLLDRICYPGGGEILEDHETLPEPGDEETLPFCKAPDTPKLQLIVMEEGVAERFGILIRQTSLLTARFFQKYGISPEVIWLNPSDREILKRASKTFPSVVILGSGFPHEVSAQFCGLILCHSDEGSAPCVGLALRAL